VFLGTFFAKKTKKCRDILKRLITRIHFQMYLMRYGYMDGGSGQSENLLSPDALKDSIKDFQGRGRQIKTLLCSKLIAFGRLQSSLPKALKPLLTHPSLPHQTLWKSVTRRPPMTYFMTNDSNDNDICGNCDQGQLE
jgi:hypothetical protein